MENVNVDAMTNSDIESTIENLKAEMIARREREEKLEKFAVVAVSALVRGEGSEFGLGDNPTFSDIVAVAEKLADEDDERERIRVEKNRLRAEKSAATRRANAARRKAEAAKKAKEADAKDKDAAKGAAKDADAKAKDAAKDAAESEKGAA